MSEPPPRWPSGLHVVEHDDQAGGPKTPPGDSPVVVLVHGSLDRAASFRRVVRRLGGYRVVTYDRRGYQGSRGTDPTGGLEGHAEDLLAVMAVATRGGERGVAVGHSFGGDVVLAAACAEPRAFAAIAAYEPPLPWFGFRRPDPRPPMRPPQMEVESFFRRMMGAESWARLSPGARAERMADGPALVADLCALDQAGRPFDLSRLGVPATFANGGPDSAEHHRRAAAWLVGHVDGADLMEVPGAGHGAHLSHPDAFAALVKRAVERAEAAEGAER